MKQARPHFLTLFLALVVFASCSEGELRTVTSLPPASATEGSPTARVTAALVTKTQQAPTATATRPLPSSTPLATLTATQTASPTARPTRTPTPTRPPATIQDSTNVVAIGERLWHPAYEQMTKPLPIETGGQPWSPDGTQLVGYDLELNGLAIFTLATGTLNSLDKTTPTSNRPWWSPNGRFLAYRISANREGNYRQLALYDIELETETMLTEPIQGVDLVAFAGWSFDSQSVAFVRWLPSIDDPEGVAVITVLDVIDKSSVQFQTPAQISIDAASWSPTTRQILAYGSYSQPAGRRYSVEPRRIHNAIYLIDVENGTVDLVKAPDDPGPPAHPYYDFPVRYFLSNQPWAPDGTGFVYSDRGTICTFEFETRETLCPDELVGLVAETGAVGAEYPSWSPSGEWIGFILKLESVYCIPFAAVSSDGTELRFTDEERGDCGVFWGTWSPRQ